ADILTRHVQQLYEFYGEYLGVRIARKHIAWYSKGRPEGAVFRNKINYSESSAEQLQAIKEYFQFLHNNRDLAA
ncbi:MAG: tRNA-dihydrouridine synthase, partial [Candidatus Thiodiazotropha taylori]|nr:tRNA-dihydrouridine synthase [Candidatus Thiodiazotropha taylori]MCW4291262.1 tRNA-dihydrouridine synthase [Candidatus Thiodiazotropha taylori]